MKCSGTPDLVRINRNIVECKVQMTAMLGCPAMRINRNIVECKEKCCHIMKKMPFSINRNIVECKGLSQALFSGSAALY